MLHTLRYQSTLTTHASWKSLIHPPCRKTVILLALPYIFVFFAMSQVKAKPESGGHTNGHLFAPANSVQASSSKMRSTFGLAIKKQVPHGVLYLTAPRSGNREYAYLVIFPVGKAMITDTSFPYDMIVVNRSVKIRSSINITEEKLDVTYSCSSKTVDDASERKEILRFHTAKHRFSDIDLKSGRVFLADLFGANPKLLQISYPLQTVDEPHLDYHTVMAIAKDISKDDPQKRFKTKSISIVPPEQLIPEN